jgi:hypothetical protein
MGLSILLLDLVSPRWLLFPILFVIPVVLSGWFCSVRLAYALAVVLPFGRFLIATFVEDPSAVIYHAANGLIRVAVLGLLAFLIGRLVRQAKEIKRLQGLLPICMHCKRIRDKNDDWQQLEAYISGHSEAQFSHGLSPECAQKYYAGLLNSKRDA